MTAIFHDEFGNQQDIIDQFSAPADALADATVHYALYRYEDYSGSALVVFEKGGKLYEVNGSHCSCYGLEGQWEPEETTWQALAMRDYNSDLSEIAKRALAKPRKKKARERKTDGK